ncbi:uncharacterized protein LOC130778034 [Actinidia eriantha]|uniref:uncharacterized protein LOC130778034 n=1 Tax=Actinidia eriantha TaxID=165200 RepID=UPI002588EE81|nr:uncharacterized protein LOC130778034 [Actinidia eriantha]
MTQYQYLRNYLNQNVHCPKLSFYAVEMPTSPTDGQNLKMGSGNGGVSLKVSCVEVNVTGREIPNQLGTGFVSGDQVSNSGIQRIRASGTAKREIRDLRAAKCRMEIQNKLNQWTMDSALHLKVSNKEGMMIEREKPKVDKNGEPKATSTGGKKDGKTNSAFSETNSVQPGKSSLSNSKVSNKEGMMIEREKPKVDKNGEPKATSTGGKKDGKTNSAFSETNSVQPGKSSLSNSKVDSSEKALEIKSMSVPDPEFYNFDKDRIEKCFVKTRFGLFMTMKTACRVTML